MNTVKPSFHRAGAAALAIALASALGACGGGGGGNDDPVPLNDPNGLMSAISGKITSGGAVVPLVNGAIPVPQSASDAPKATAGTEQTTAAPGDTVTLPVFVDGLPDLSNLYAKITGATTSYFNVEIAPPSGKRAMLKAETSSQLIPIVVATTLDFRVALPDNLDLSTGNKVCFSFSVRERGSNVRSPEVESCIDLVSTTPVPTNDQPAANQLAAALAGSWVSRCIDVDDPESNESDEIKGVKLGVGFGSGRSFNQFFETYGTSDCSDAGEGSGAVIDGTYEAADQAVYNAQVRRFQRAIDFFPNDPFEGTQPDIRIEPCYNVLSLSGNNVLFLGLPTTFTVDFGDGQAGPAPGDCRAEDTRPAAVLTAIPFTKR